MSRNITVAARFRPKNDLEMREGGGDAVFIEGNRISVENPENGKSLSFEFDTVFDEDANQETVFNKTAKDLIKAVFEGYNGTIFAYGQTGSGKTYTMDGGGHGIIYKSIKLLFDLINNCQDELEFSIGCSFFELYLERIQDLLDPSLKGLAVKNDSNTGGVYVSGCHTQYVSTSEEVFYLLKLGNKHRHTTATMMNQHSSRSHSIFLVTLSSKNLKSGESKSSKLYLVDLAGSEKVKKTGAEGIVLQEAKNINKSLSCLGNVINALTKSRPSYVPYRDSKLTRLLQDSIGGTAISVLIICCSTAPYNINETISTLRFGFRAKCIKNSPLVNRHLSEAELKRLLQQARATIQAQQRDINTLRKKLGLPPLTDPNISGIQGQDNFEKSPDLNVENFPLNNNGNTNNNNNDDEGRVVLEERIQDLENEMEQLQEAYSSIVLEKERLEKDYMNKVALKGEEQGDLITMLQEEIKKNKNQKEKLNTNFKEFEDKFNKFMEDNDPLEEISKENLEILKNEVFLPFCDAFKNKKSQKIEKTEKTEENEENEEKNEENDEKSEDLSSYFVGSYNSEQSESDSEENSNSEEEMEENEENFQKLKKSLKKKKQKLKKREKVIQNLNEKLRIEATKANNILKDFAEYKKEKEEELRLKEAEEDSELTDNLEKINKILLKNKKTKSKGPVIKKIIKSGRNSVGNSPSNLKMTGEYDNILDFLKSTENEENEEIEENVETPDEKTGSEKDEEKNEDEENEENEENEEENEEKNEENEEENEEKNEENEEEKGEEFDDSEIIDNEICDGEANQEKSDEKVENEEDQEIKEEENENETKITEIVETITNEKGDPQPIIEPGALTIPEKVEIIVKKAEPSNEEMTQQNAEKKGEMDDPQIPIPIPIPEAIGRGEGNKEGVEVEVEVETVLVPQQISLEVGMDNLSEKECVSVECQTDFPVFPIQFQFPVDDEGKHNKNKCCSIQ